MRRELTVPFKYLTILSTFNGFNCTCKCKYVVPEPGWYPVQDIYKNFKATVFQGSGKGA